MAGKKRTKPDDLAAIAKSAVANAGDSVEEAEDLLL